MKVPKEFQAPIKAEYPPDNKIIFEQWLIDNIGEYPGDRIYLPINWCGFFVNHNYGKNRTAMQSLQRFLNGIDRSKKYWTCTQYDLGILSNINHLDIKVYGSGGGRIDFPIPLVCQPHGVQVSEREYWASFAGSMTHPIRKEMLNIKRAKIVTDHMPIKEYCKLMSESIFVLAPRGFGLTSFRICEALEQGCVPIYISDEFIQPFNIDFNDYGILTKLDDLETLFCISNEEIDQKLARGREIYRDYFTYEGLRKRIIETL